MKYELLTWCGMSNDVTIHKEYEFYGNANKGFKFKDDVGFRRATVHGSWAKQVKGVQPSNTFLDKKPTDRIGDKLTGGSSSYYKAYICKHHMIVDKPAYIAECNDIIEALKMNFAEGNAFKALWRKASKRLGNGKAGTTALYDAEKVKLFGERLVQQES